MKPLPLALLLQLCLALSPIQSFGNRFAIVLIDPESERQFGEFPLDRGLVAKGIDRLADMQARGVVLKFFYDLPKAPESDAALAQAIGRLPTILQARIDDTELRPNPLPERFFFTEVPTTLAHVFSGRSGWMPLPIFSAKAHDVGFVDLPAPGQTDIVENYQGRIVRGLVLSCLELAFDSRAKIIPGKSITFGSKTIPLNPNNRVPIRFPPKDQLEYLKFHDLFTGKIEPRQIKDKVVILGYDGVKIPKLESPLGPIGAHRYFIYAVTDLSDRLDQAEIKDGGK